MNDLNDRRRGALYGEAIGDALGAWYEFSGDLPAGKLAEYKASFLIGTGGATDDAGEFTDDTAQALIVASALTEAGDGPKKASLLLAAGFQKWFHEDGRGCGHLTAHVLRDGLYAAEPLAVAKMYWESGGKQSAPNGGVMRTIGAALVRPWDLRWTVNNAALACRVTHYDPRCVASCVAVSAAAALLMRDHPLEVALRGAIVSGQHYEKEVVEFIGRPHTDEKESLKALHDLKLGEPHKIGYTYKCLGAGFWALQEYFRDPGLGMHEILSRVIREGGDTDTNAAVAGALVGTVIGYTGLPKDLVGPLKRKGELDAVLEALPKEP